MLRDCWARYAKWSREITDGGVSARQSSEYRPPRWVGERRESPAESSLIGNHLVTNIRRCLAVSIHRRVEAWRSAACPLQQLTDVRISSGTTSVRWIMTRRHLLDGFVTTLIATLAVTACDQSKPTSPITAAPNAEPRFSKGGGGTPSTARGDNFQIKSFVDNDFCIQVAGGTIEGRTITMQLCAADALRLTRWTLSDNNDGTNLILDTQGMCLDGNFRRGEEGLARSVQKCGFEITSRFTFTSAGTIRDEKNNMCLKESTAAANAAVFLADCDPTNVNQRWVAAH